MNYGGEFDKQFMNTQAARDFARKQGRRGTVTAQILENAKPKNIAGFDATIIEVPSAHEGSSLHSYNSTLDVNNHLPQISGDEGTVQPSEINNANNADEDDDNSNEYDWNEEDDDDDLLLDEKQHQQKIPQSLLLRRGFWC